MRAATIHEIGQPYEPSANPEPASRRYLIAIGSPTSPGAPSLPGVAPDVDAITALFTSSEQGYERVLADRIPIGATAATIKTELATWFASSDRAESDCVIVYFAGHGYFQSNFGHHYLLTADTSNALSTTAVKTSSLTELFFEGTGPRPANVLVFLDLCYAGAGGGQAAAALAAVKSGAVVGGGAGFWIIASADSHTLADDGDFVRALEGAMRDEAYLTRGGVKYYNPIDLKDAINEWFAKHKSTQRAEADVVGSSNRHQFIRNPRFAPEADGVALADEAHWDPKARGVEGMGSTGWFFRGRTEALRTLVRWLEAPESDLRARIVVGSPGSGKSAVVSRLVTSANPAKRKEMEAADALSAQLDTHAPVGSVDAHVHLRGARLDDVVATLCSQLRIPDTSIEGLLKALRVWATPVRIIVDALDEAPESIEIERNLLRALATTPTVRLVVATRRRGDIVPLADVGILIDLDTPAFFLPADVVDFVTARLLGREPPTIYGKEARVHDAECVADAVARRAGHSFLYARIVSQWLGHADRVVDTREDRWEERLRLPSDLSQAFGEDLDRFDHNTRRQLIDLFVPLAYARGKGLPQKQVWAAVASAFAESHYTNADIRDAKTTAGYYVIQDSENGEAVFRLFHETFAEYLRHLTANENVHRTIAEALMKLSSPEGGTPKWGQVREPYIRNHIAAHAARGGLLDGLIGDPEFVFSMPVNSVLPELAAVTDDAARRASVAYRQRVHCIRDGDPDRVAHLQLAAMQSGATALVERLASMHNGERWRPKWAVSHSIVPSEVIASCPGPVRAIVADYLDDDTPIVAAAYEGRVALWDLTSGIRLGESPAFSGHIISMSVATTNHLKLLVTTWSTLDLRVFGLPSCMMIAERRAADGLSSDWGEAVTVAHRKGEPIVVTAGSDGTIRVWSLPMLAPLDRRLNAHAAGIKRLLGARVAGREVVITGGVVSYKDVQREEKHLVRIWTTSDLSLVAQFPNEAAHSVGALHVLREAGRELLLVNYYPQDQIELWDLATGERILEAYVGFHVVDVVPWRGKRRLIGSRYGPLQDAILDFPDEDRRSPRLIPSPDTGAFSDKWSSAVRVGDRFVTVSAGRSELRLWDLAELLADESGFRDRDRTSPLDANGNDAVSAMAVAVGERTCIVVGSAIGWLHMFDSKDGSLLWSRRVTRDCIIGIAVIPMDEASCIVVADIPGRLTVARALDGSLVTQFDTKSEIRGLAASEVDGTPLAFVATNYSTSEHGVRVWNLATGRRRERLTARDLLAASMSIDIGSRLQDALSDKMLRCVAVGDVAGQPRLFFAGPASRVSSILAEWDDDDERIVYTMSEGMSDDIRRISVGRIGDQPVLLAMNNAGVFCAWNVSTRERIAEIKGAHEGSVDALALSSGVSRYAFASAGSDGVVKLWSATFAVELSIDVADPVVSLAFVPDGALAIATDRGVAVLRLQ